jgi:hypothetical protein
MSRSLSWIKVAPVLVVLTISTVLSVTAKAQVVCNARDKGRYTWGESPDGCDAGSIGDASKVKSLYGNFTYDMRKNDSAHIQSYMNNMNALIRDLSADYIRRRQPGVDSATVNSFVRAIESVATQESYWTHYRWGKDSGLKVMTGDNTHSLGMMQLHDGGHASSGRLNRFDLTANILMGVEQFYNEWKRAGTKECVLNSSNKLISQAKAAYAAYNGGPGSVCRWADSSSKWAENDIGYYQKYSKRPWMKLVTDENMKSPVDIECLKAGRVSCAGRSDKAPEQTKTQPAPVVTSAAQITGKLLVLEDGRQCFSTDSKTLYCATDLRTFSCLEAYSPAFAKAEVVKMSADVLKSRSLEVKAYASRDELCRTAVKDMILPGQSLRVKTDRDLLDKVDGKTVAKAKAGDVLQVVDYEISGLGANLQYRVQTADGKFLWVMAGPIAARKVEKSATSASSKLLPNEGDKVVTLMKEGMNMRSAASRTAGVVDQIPLNTTVKVLAVVSSGGNGERWLQVQNSGHTGFIFSGHTFPESDVNTWIKLVK